MLFSSFVIRRSLHNPSRNHGRFVVGARHGRLHAFDGCGTARKSAARLDVNLRCYSSRLHRQHARKESSFDAEPDFHVWATPFSTDTSSISFLRVAPEPSRCHLQKNPSGPRPIVVPKIGKELFLRIGKPRLRSRQGNDLSAGYIVGVCVGLVETLRRINEEANSPLIDCRC